MSNNITNNYLILHSSYYLTPETHLDTNLHIIIYSLVFSCDQVPTKTALDRCYGDIQYAKLGEEATAFQTSLSSFSPLPFYILVFGDKKRLFMLLFCCLIYSLIVKCL